MQPDGLLPVPKQLVLTDSVLADLLIGYLRQAGSDLGFEDFRVVRVTVVPGERTVGRSVLPCAHRVLATYTVAFGASFCAVTLNLTLTHEDDDGTPYTAIEIVKIISSLREAHAIWAEEDREPKPPVENNKVYIQ